MQPVHKRPRPEFRNIHVTDLMSYRLPLAGIVSILHRVSGASMFVLLPLVLWAFDASLSSSQGWSAVASAFSAWPMKIVALGLFWALAHHLCAGLRHVLMEVCHAVAKDQGRRWAAVSLVASLLLTAAFGFQLFTGV